jgi:hypothetical protein
MYSSAGLELTQVAIAAVLLGLAIPCLLSAYSIAVAEWRAADRTSRAWLVSAIAVAAALRWLVFPRWLAMVFIGYLQTERAIELLPLGQYGAGAVSFYHALFAVLPHDHAYLMAANSVVAVLTLPLTATVGARLFGSARVGAVTAMAIAVTPLFIRNDNSEANNVPTLWWLFGGLLLWTEHRLRGRRSDGLMAVCLLTLAAVARPEMPFLIVGLIVVLGRLLPTKPRDRVVAMAVVLAVIATTPHLVHIRNAATALGNTRPLGFVANYAMRFQYTVALRNVVIDPRLYPVALLGLAVWSAVRTRASRVLLVAALLAFAVYVVDLDRGNMARAEVPAALLVTMAASAGAVHALERIGKMLWLAIAATAALTIPFIFARTNEQAEDEFIRVALAALPFEPKIFVRHGVTDLNRAGDEGFTQQHFPDYFLDTRAGPVRLSTIGDFQSAPDFSAPVFFYFGVRCYGRFRGEGKPPPHGEQLQPSCAAMRERFRLTPVVEKTIPNRGDVWLEYYSDQPTFLVGLYRVRPNP